MDPADFYTGIVAELYGPLKAHRQEAEPYARFIAAHGQPALELGCGDGEPLLELRERGLDVEGVDSSGDLLERCRSLAENAGIDVTLHHQRMENLQLPRRYASVFLAGPTFTLLPDDRTALAALHGIRRHLAPGGAAMIPLFVPSPTPPDQIGKTSEKTVEGATVSVTPTAQERHDHNRTQRTVLRYERRHRGDHVAEDRTWVLHWHTQQGFSSLADQAGLTVTAVNTPDGEPAGADATAFTFILRAA